MSDERNLVAAAAFFFLVAVAQVGFGFVAGYSYNFSEEVGKDGCVCACVRTCVRYLRFR